MSNRPNKSLAGSLLALSFLATPPVPADDVEIYVAPPTEVIPPNALFLLDFSASMNARQSRTNPTKPIDNLKEALDTVLNDPANADVNAAFLVFYDDGAYAIHDFDRVGDNSASMLNAVATTPIGSDTSTTYGIAAAMLWFEQGYQGKASPLAGTQPEGNWCKPNLIIYMGDGKASTVLNRPELIEPNTNNELRGTLSVPASASERVFLLPPQGNNNSDVIPSRYRGADCRLYTVHDTNDMAWYRNPDNPGQNTLATAGYNSGLCIQEMIEWGLNADLKTGGEWDWDSNDSIQSPATRRRQNIRFYSVHFGKTLSDDDLAWKYSKFLAETGDGSMYEGFDAKQLTNAFNTILQDAMSAVQYTYTAPSVPYDQNNAAVSGDYIYVPLFKPGVHPLWYGNLKKFKIGYETVNGIRKVVIRDKFDGPVVGQNHLFQSATDLWNQGPSDGGEPLAGGAASNMTTTPTRSARKLYTWLGGDKDLTHASNRVEADNAGIDAARLGPLSSTLYQALGNSFDERKKIILDWMTWAADPQLPDGNGGTVTVSHKGEMGAPLHTHPLHIVAAPGNASKKEYVFITTTEGVLHALDGATGEELWAFMPADLLPTIPENFLSDWDFSKPHSASGEAIPSTDHGHVLKPHYGLDGPLISYVHNSKTYLVMGMRRGGRNYYALDITDPEKPRFAWMIEGGTGSFTALGQTWSKPLFTKVDIGGSGNPQDVLVIAGGYDPAQDQSYDDANGNGIFDAGETAYARKSDGMGNILYFVDPATGALHATLGAITSSDLVEGQMNNGIVADPFPVDINTNGVTDRLYLADVGGRIIRVDIPDAIIKNLTNRGAVSATVVADVNIDANGNVQPGTDYQRFFAMPEVAYFNRGGVQYLALMISSGNRAEPLSGSVSHDRFYMIKDPNVWLPPPDNDNDGQPDYPEPITEDSNSTRFLYDATANLIQTGNAQQQAQAQAELNRASGWFVNLGAGEKGFTRPIVYDYAVLFTTYKGTRPDTSNDPCKVPVPQSESFFYALEMTNGGAKFSAMDGQQGLDTSDRSRKIDLPGLPPAPSLLFPKITAGNSIKLGGEVLALVGLEEVARWRDRFHPISWEEVVED